MKLICIFQNKIILFFSLNLLHLFHFINLENLMEKKAKKA